MWLFFFHYLHKNIDMEAIVVCNRSFKECHPENKYYDFKLCGENVIVSLIEDSRQLDKNQLKEYSVLVKVYAFSCNYRDKGLLLYFNDMCQNFDNENKPFASPFGSEFIAQVIEVGKNVTKLKVGDLVIPDGSYPCRKNGKLGGLPTNYASQRFHCFDENQVVKIPDTMPYEIAASFTIASQTAYSMVRKLELTKESKVLVTAATSNTSLAAIRILVAKGISTYALSSSTQYENELLNLGIQKFIPADALVDNTMQDYLDGVFFDAIIDPFYDIYFTQLIGYMNYNAKYIYCGLYNQSLHYDSKGIQSNLNDPIIISSCIMRNISTLGNCLGSENDLLNALKDYTQGSYNITLDSAYTGESIIQFLNKTFNNNPRFGKVVYKYND